MATKKTSSTTPRTRAKKASVQNPEVASDNGSAAATAPAKVSATSPAPNFDHPAEIQERIRQRAYELFEQRGGMHGFDIEDWLNAEAEISGGESK